MRSHNAEPATFEVPYIRSHFYQLVSVYANDSCCAKLRLVVDVLMPVNRDARLCPLDIRLYRVETVVYFVLLIVDASGRVMRHENVDGWKATKKTLGSH